MIVKRLINPNKEDFPVLGPRAPLDFFDLYAECPYGCIWFPLTSSGWGLIHITWRKDILKRKIVTIKIS